MSEPRWAVMCLTASAVYGACKALTWYTAARVDAPYIAIFWGVRLLLQTVFDVRTFLTRWWLKAGYALLTIMFAAFTAIDGWAASHSAALS